MADKEQREEKKEKELHGGSSLHRISNSMLDS